MEYKLFHHSGVDTRRLAREPPRDDFRKSIGIPEIIEIGFMLHPVNLPLVRICQQTPFISFGIAPAVHCVLCSVFRC